jgi:hypothetical protein
VLEARDLPAVTIQLDYTYDAGFFTNNPAARAVMQEVATELGNMLNTSLAAITPGGTNSWSATFYSPSTGAQVSVANPTIPANTLKVYVGGRAIPGTEGGFGGAGGYVLNGSTDWDNAVLSRSHAGYAPWGGSITFDTTVPWYFGQSASGLTTSQVDFYTAAMHEMGHLLGIGTSAQWNSYVSGNAYVGPAAESVYGGPVPLSSDHAHWADGVKVGGALTVMDPILKPGARATWTALDAAALHDIGWGTTYTVSPPVVSPPPPVVSPPPPVVSPPPPAKSPPVVSPPPPVVSPPPAPKPPATVAFASGADGTLAVYQMSGGALTATGQRFTPFPGYRGELRVTGGDFNGDGITDYAVTTGPGFVSMIAILNGKDGSYLVGPTLPYGAYTGGLYLAAGNIDGSGKDELVVSLGQGAPPLVQTFRVAGGLQLVASFIAFDAPSFTGGVRVAVGDINHDGYADVVITTASQLAVVGIYSGASLRSGTASRLIPDFAPFGALPVGLNVAVGDLDGDGYGDLVVGLDRGMVPFVAVWSGKALSTGKSPAPIRTFLALPPDTNGARVAVRDLTGDGRAELIVAGGGSVPVARTYTFAQIQSGSSGSASIYPALAPGTSGIYVG